MLVKMFSLLILLKQISEVVVTEKIPITLAGFADIHLTSDEGWSSAGVIPAIMMALDDVNARDDILRDYELKINLADSKVGNSVVLKYYIDLCILYAAINI